MAKVLRWPAGQKQEKPQMEKGIYGFLKRIFEIQEQGAPDKGSIGEWKVARELASSLSNDWIIINDIKINLNQGKTQIDHLVLGPSGILCLETKNWNSAACNERGEWFRYQNKLWVPQRSPLAQHMAKVEALTNQLQSLVAGIKIQGIIVFANPGKFDFSQARLPVDIKVMGLPGLTAYLQRSALEGSIYSEEQLACLVEELGF